MSDFSCSRCGASLEYKESKYCYQCWRREVRQQEFRERLEREKQKELFDAEYKSLKVKQ